MTRVRVYHGLMTNSTPFWWVPDTEEISTFRLDLQEGISEADYEFGKSLDESYDIGYSTGFKAGYQLATAESYPELNDDGDTVRDPSAH